MAASRPRPESAAVLGDLERQAVGRRQDLGRQHAGNRAGGDDAPIRQHQRVREPGRDLLDVVGDQDDGGRVVSHGEIGQSGCQGLASAEVEPGGGLVEEQQGGVGHQRAGDLDALALARGEGPEGPLAKRAAAHSLEEQGRPTSVGIGEGVPPRRERRVPGRHDDVDRAEVRVDGRRQRRAGVADRSSQLARVDRAHLCAEDADQAARRPEVGAEDLEQRRLAGAVGTQHDPTLPVPDRPVDVGQDGPARPHDGDPAEFDHGFGHGRSIADLRPGPRDRGRAAARFETATPTRE